MKYRRNNFLRFLLLLAMTVSMFQIFAVTAQATTLDALKSAFSIGGDYQLGAHIITTETLQVENDKLLSLNLNGYGILTSKDGYVIQIGASDYNATTLNLYDSRPNVPNYIIISNTGVLYR